MYSSIHTVEGKGVKARTVSEEGGTPVPTHSTYYWGTKKESPREACPSGVFSREGRHTLSMTFLQIGT